MKKILILLIASASMLLADANVTTTAVVEGVKAEKVVTATTKTEVASDAMVKKPCKCKTKGMKLEQKKCKCASGAKCSCKGECKGMKKNRNSTKGMNRGNYGHKNFKKGNKRAKKSPLLVEKGLTPLLRIVMMSAKDKLLGLDVEQYAKLMVIKKDMMTRSKEMKKELRAISKSVKMSVASGTTVDAIRDDVIKLASLRANITLLRIECMNRTKEILTKDQLIYLLGKSANKRNKSHAKKCNSKKCHSKKDNRNRYNKNR